MASNCQPQTSLVTRQVMYYTATKLHNALPSNIKIQNNNKKVIKLPLEDNLLAHSYIAQFFSNERPYTICKLLRIFCHKYPII